jgi:hypothetical protein
MVQVIENRADVRGRIVGVAPHPTMSGYELVELAVASVTAVTGYANLFGEHAGKVVSVTVASAEARAQGLAPGDTLAARIRRTGPQAIFADSGSLVKAG